MNFVKMEGCANDFILTDELQESGLADIAARTPHLCDRRRGIGADGIIFVLPSDVADYKMRIFNADGSEPEMCGNGIRCFGMFLKEKGLVSGSSLRVETLAGIKTIDFVDSGVRVDMGAPVLDGESIPVRHSGTPVVNVPVTVADGTGFAVTAVSMGNPHAVIYADELTDRLVLEYGKELEGHTFFPRRVNVEFVKVLSEHEVTMRVFERGVGETMACGTGACATAVAGILNGKHANQVTVHLLGGDLLIEWDGDPQHSVMMTGPANWVYEGNVHLG